MESSDNVSYFYEKHALDGRGDLLVDESLALNKVGHALHRLHPAFAACTYSDRVTDVCRALGLGDPVVPQSMYIYKNPGVGGEGETVNRIQYTYVMIYLLFTIKYSTLSRTAGHV